MDDLRKASTEGIGVFLDSLAHFPRRHPFWIAGTALGLVAGYFLIAGVFEAKRDINILKPQITQIRRGDPCVALAQTSPEKAKQARLLTSRCVSFLDGIAPFVSTKLACAIVEKGGYVCKALPVIPDSGKRNGGEAQTPSNAGQQPGPPSGGHHGGSKGTHHAPPKHEPTADPAPAAPAPEPPSPAPGNSGGTPGGEHGVKACVEVVVSACVNAETPALPLNP